MQNIYQKCCVRTIRGIGYMRKNSSKNNSIPMPFKEKYCPQTISGDCINGYDLVGYCHHYKHKGYLMKNHIKEHKCIEKGCPHLEKNELSHLFTNKDFIKEKKKYAKKLKKLWFNEIISTKMYLLYDTRLREVSTKDELLDFLFMTLDRDILKKM